MDVKRRGASGDISVRQATQTARRMVGLSFAGLAFVFSCLFIDQVIIHQRYQDVLNNAGKVIELSWLITQTGNEMTTAASMTAATGSTIWIGVYNGLQPRGAELIERLAQHLPEDLADDTRKRLIDLGRARRDMDERVFSLVYAHDLASAQALVNSGDYRDTTLLYGNLLEEVRQSARKTVATEVRKFQIRSWLVSAALVLLGALIYVAVWRRLNRDMNKSEAAFALAEARLEQLTSFDPLTGMPNRQRLIEEMQQMMIRGERSGQQLAVIALDIDGFRAINDQFGHEAGDRVLCEVGRRIVSSVRQDEIAARLGDDEFAIAISCQNSQDAPMRVARRIMDLISQTQLVDGLVVDVRATAGVAIWPDDSALPDELLRKADVALARAKAESRGEVRFFQPGMDADLRERIRLQTELKQAIAEGQIIPYFQPVVDLETGSIQGFEVLARWSHPTRGIIAPTAFISFAEDSGLISDLTFSLLRTALMEAREWPGEPTIAINISQRQLIDSKLAGKLLAVLADVDFPPHRFEVEVTENALASDIRTAKYILYGLRSRGVRILLDDFGTGYSCLGHLAQLPVDKIKIDRSFTRTMHGQEQSATIIKSIIGLGRSLGLPVIAEGIETQEDAAALLAMGCATAQGYFFSPPLPGASAERLLGRHLGYGNQENPVTV